MPELPEVETVCRGLALRLQGRRLLRVDQRRPDLRFPLPENFAARLTGRRIERIARRAKFILAHLDDGTVLVCHLGMSGRMVLSDGLPEGGPEPHDHVIFHADDGTVLRFNDARRFGLMDLVPELRLATHPLLAGLGPEPLGKIYASESLFWAGLSPRRLARTVQGARAERLAAAIKRVLTEAIAAGGSSLRDYVQATGELGYFQHRWAVYDRAGQRCPTCDCADGPAARADGFGIRRIVQSGRATFYCARRQR